MRAGELEEAPRDDVLAIEPRDLATRPILILLALTEATRLERAQSNARQARLRPSERMTGALSLVNQRGELEPERAILILEHLLQVDGDAAFRSA